MYNLLLFGLTILGLWLAHRGFAGRRPLLLRGGAGMVLATLGLFSVLGLWGEGLWFHALGYGARFWTILGAQAGAALAGALVAAGGVHLLGRVLRGGAPSLSPWVELAAGAGGAVWGLASWERVLLFLNRAPAGVREPVLGRDAGFYLFELPFLDALLGLLLWILVAAAAAVVIQRVRRVPQHGEPRPLLEPRALGTLSLALGAVVGLGAILEVFALLYSEWGVVAGPGWTDVHVRLPAYLLLAVATLALGGLPLLPGARRLSVRWARRLAPDLGEATAAVAVPWSAVGVLWVALAGLLPAAFQWLVVEPNEITYEKPYIARNIEWTRRGFDLEEVEERQFPATETLTRQALEENRRLLSEIRLWDWRALDAVYQQFQEIRLYYEFTDVDVDRYTVGDRYRQVMVSARELAQDNLPRQSRTFVNRRFKYTHGYGLTLATVSDFTPQGLPNLLVKDIPPKAAYPELEVTRPEIYYGELTEGPAVVNTEEREFDYPAGERNVYVRYAGEGGVELSNLWRKFLFGWKFDGTRFLLSSYPTARSRVMFHREIRERVDTLAPFLELDRDPYLVLVDGRLYWIVDAYTTSDRYPYSEPFSAREPGVPSRSSEVAYLDGVSYVRNSVKVVVDAYQGSVDFYVYEPTDPLIRAWRSVLPHMFKDRDAMPEGLRAHVRYPQGFLLTQGLVYTKYHMGDPEVFYNQEDLWVRATEKHYDRVEPVQPYYVMWELPGSDEPEFVLMLPFTPKNRQVMIGWIAGLSDGANYGRFLAYKFPKEKRVLGPQQVETKIDQDSFLSGQLTLWDQRGSNVIRGNVLGIPLDDTLLYVEPIYLQAETAAYPELRLVVVMHGDTMSYAESFDQALQGLLEESTPVPGRRGIGAWELGRRANAAFEHYLEALGESRFDEASAALADLQALLSRLAKGRADAADGR